MKRLLTGSASFALATIMAQTIASASPVVSCEISGVVVDHLTNRPLNRVLVRLSPVKTPAQEVAALTGTDGRFAFTHLALGKYRLSAQRRGGNPQFFHGDGADYSTAVVVAPTHPAEDVAFPFYAPSSISGVVLDEEAEPVSSAQVVVFEQRVFEGEKQIVQRRGDATNSLGQFSIGELPPGLYFVAVHGKPWFSQIEGQFTRIVNGKWQQSRPPPELDVVYPLTYYAGTTDPASASPIVLLEGAQARIQINLHAVPAMHVRLTGVPTDLTRGLSVNLSAQGPGNTQVDVGYSFGTESNGFEMSGIAPGKYTMRIQGFSNGKSHALRDQTADLSDGAVLAVQIPETKISVSGQVTFEGSKPPQAKLFLAERNWSLSVSADIAADGSFTVPADQLRPGSYSVRLSTGHMIRSIDVKGARAIGDEIELLENSPATISIVATSAEKLAKLDGIAFRADQPVPGAMVLLVPQNLKEGRFFRRDQSDSDGSFTLSAILPGRYTLLAIDDGHDLAYKDPAVIKPYLSRGVPVTIPAQDSEPIKIPVQSRIADHNS